MEGVADRKTVITDDVFDVDLDQDERRRAQELVASGYFDEVDFMSDSDYEDSETIRTKNRSGFSDRALEHKYKDKEHVGYTIFGHRVMKVLDSSNLGELMRKDEGNKDDWRTIVDFANQKEIKLTPRDIEIIRKVRSGKFPGFKFDPYNPKWSTVDFDYEYPEMPLSDNLPKQRFLKNTIDEQRRINRIVRYIQRGMYRDPEEYVQKVIKERQENMSTDFDVWVANIKTKKRELAIVPAPKIRPPSHADSYNPHKEFADETTDPQPTLRRVETYKPLLDELYERLVDLYTCPRSYQMTLNIDRESLLPPLPPIDSLKPFPVDIKLHMRGLTAYRLKGDDGSAKMHFDRVFNSPVPVTAVEMSPCGAYVAIGDKRGVVSVLHLIYPHMPGVVIWRDTLHLADDSRKNKMEETRITALRFHPIYPVLTILKGCYIFYVIIPEIIGQMPIKLNLPPSTEEQAIDTYWKIYEDTPLAPALALLGLYKDGPAGQYGHDSALGRTNAKHRTIFSISTARMKKEQQEEEEMGEEELDIIDRAGPGVTVGSGSIYLRSRPGLSLITRQRYAATNGNWHKKGKYFAVCSSTSPYARDSVIVHAVTRWTSLHVLKTRLPRVHNVWFHPEKSILFVCHNNGIRCLNLTAGKVKTDIVTHVNVKGGKQGVCSAMHPNGDVIVRGNTSQQLMLYDLSKALKPIQTITTMHGIQTETCIHEKRPLVACVGSNGEIMIIHVAISKDVKSFMIPVKRLTVKGRTNIGKIVNCCWHKTKAWLLTTHEDGSICLWT